MDAIIIFSSAAAIVIAIVAAIFVIYRRGLRFAKGIERGIKMVPILISLPPSSDDIEVGGRDVRDVIQERISQAEVLYNLIASTATKGFKSKFFGQRHIGLEIVAIDGVIRLYAAVPVALVAVVKQAILTAYPGAQLDEVEDHNVFSETGKISGTYGGEVVLKQPYSYPIATANELKRDAMQAIIKSLTNLDHGDGASLQILIRPAREGWTKASESLVRKKQENKGEKSGGSSTKALLQAPFKPPESSGDNEQKAPKQLTNKEQSVLDAIEQKTKSSGYETTIRVVASSGTSSKAQSIVDSLVSAFSLFDAPGLNGFKFQPAKNMEKFVTDFIFRFFPPEKSSMILNSVELASLFHFPDDQFSKTTQLQRQASKQVEGPSRISKEGLVIGHNVYHGVKKEIRLSDEDRRRHVYIVGQTGTGKSTMLENLMVQDMTNGKGFAFIDPHGDAAEKMLGMVPKDRTEDVIYFDPGNLEHPLGLNIFEYHSEDQKDFLIQEAINMLYRLYDPQHTGIIGPRYEHLFRNAALTVMAGPEGGTFVDIPKLFRDPQFVRQKLKHVEDQSVREFWQKEMPQSQRSNDFGEIVSWFVSKFGAFLSNQLMRNTIGQTKSAFDLRELMDSDKILIANLSKGRLGELNSQLLGMIFVMKFQAAAMSRASIPEDQRKDFSLYVDEFQNFSTESFAFILSEARKYRMNLIVANQFISQLSEEVRDAVFGNVGTILSYRTGPADADFLVKQFAPAFTERDLVNLPNFNAAIRLMSEGLPTKPFNIATLPPFASDNPKLSEALKKLSAAKYARPRAEVEKEIFDRLSVKQAPSPFDSLSSQGSSSGATPQPQAPSTASSPDGSFLDEWLAKRKQTLSQQKAASSTAAGDSSGGAPSIQKTPSSPRSNFAAAKTTHDQTPANATQQSSSGDDVSKNTERPKAYVGSSGLNPEDTKPSQVEPSRGIDDAPEDSDALKDNNNISYSEESTKSHFSNKLAPPEKKPSLSDTVLEVSPSEGVDEVGRVVKPQVSDVEDDTLATTSSESVDNQTLGNDQNALKTNDEKPSLKKDESEEVPSRAEPAHKEDTVKAVESSRRDEKTASSIDSPPQPTVDSPQPSSSSPLSVDPPTAPAEEAALPSSEESDGTVLPEPSDNIQVDATTSSESADDTSTTTESSISTDDIESIETPTDETNDEDSKDPEEALATIGASLSSVASSSESSETDDSSSSDNQGAESEKMTDKDLEASEDDETPDDPSGQHIVTGTIGAPVNVGGEKTEEKPSETSEPKKQEADVDPAIANLKPGEIYIDDEGNIHQG